MGGHWLIALLALPGACQEPPGYQQKLERARHRIAQLERVVQQLRSELDGLRPPFAALWHARGVAARQGLPSCGGAGQNFSFGHSPRPRQRRGGTGIP